MRHTEHLLHDPHAAPRRGPTRLLLLVLSGLLAVTWMDLRRCHARRRLERTPPSKPEVLQTWEDEGGGIPAVRGQSTPRAAAHPSESAPLAD